MAEQPTLVDRVPDVSTSQPQPPSLNPTDSVAALCRHRHETTPNSSSCGYAANCSPNAPLRSGRRRCVFSVPAREYAATTAGQSTPEAGCSGLLIPSDGGYKITVTSSEPQERQNFSTAHEIVHTFFRDAAVSTVAMTSQRPDRSGWLGQS